MIIVCAGPDTYRAREKARELVAAFRTKHDPNGLATDVIDGSEGLPALLSRLAGGSLFATKKLIRADGCLEKMKIADVRTLAARLEADHDNTIVLTVEEESPNAKTLDALKIAPLFHYPFEMQAGAAFRAWVRKEAATRGVVSETADVIAMHADGDSWLALHELEKQAVHPQNALASVSDTRTIFSVADAIISASPKWRTELSTFGEDGAISVGLGQARSFIEVRDGHADSVHPYVARKLASMRIPQAEERTAQLLRGFLSSRSGLSAGSETETLL
jgi:hypothetical protein